MRVYPSHIPTIIRKLNAKSATSFVRPAESYGICSIRVIEPIESASPKLRSDKVSILILIVGTIVAESSDKRVPDQDCGQECSPFTR